MNTYRFSVTVELDVASDRMQDARELLVDQLIENLLEFSGRQRDIELTNKNLKVKGRKIE
jgi:hypothetical protein